MALPGTLAALDDADPGEVIDVATGERFRGFDDSTWASIAESYERRRRGFQAHFGELTAAISADEVFDHIQRQRANE